MGYIRYASDVSAPVDVAFTYAANHLFTASWMFGVSCFTPSGEKDHGLGAVFRTTLQVPLWNPQLECEITEYRHGAVIGYSLPGRIPTTLTLQFAPLGHGRSVLTSQIDYRLPHGIAGRLSARPTESVLRSVLRRTESRLRTAIEQSHGTDLVGRIA